jgi:DNA-binding transcriptional ArsR family regulator
MARTRAEWEPVASLFRLASSPTATALLLMLAVGERPASELTEGAWQSHSGSANRLATLRLAGLVDRRREGHHVYYRLTDLGRAVVALAELATMWK